MIDGTNNSDCPYLAKLTTLAVADFGEDMSYPAKEYALYKGDKLLAMGTKKEIAKQLGVKTSTIGFYSHPSYAKRTSEEKGRRLVPLNE